MLFTSEPGIFAELVSISSTRSAGVSDSAYFIKSIELRPTFDLFSRCPQRIARLRDRLVRGITDRGVVLPHSSTDAPRGSRERRVRWSVIVAEAARRRWLRWRRGY